MDEKELVKTGVGASVEAILKPFSDLVTRLFGGSADELGLMMQDTIRARRIIRQAKLYGKVKSAIEECGFEPQQVPDKIWMPLLQSASVEDDEFLQDQWAWLLVNAANPETAANIQASFPGILSSLSKADAVFLNAIYDSVCEQMGRELPPGLRTFRMLDIVEIGEESFLMSIYAEAGLTVNGIQDLLTMGGQSKPHIEEDLSGFEISTRNLLRQQLIASHLVLKSDNTWANDGKIEQKERYAMTILGYELVKACRRPMKA